MSEGLLTDIPKEGEPLEEIDEGEKDTPQDSSTEEKTKKEEPSQGGEDNTPDEDKIPFHKHPRWKEVYSKNQELEKAVAELTRFKEEAEPRLKEIGEKKQPIPSWFQDTFGDNPDAWEKYQSYEKDLRQQIKSEIYQEQEKFAQTQAAESAKWSNWTKGQIQQLKDEGLEFDQNELLKVLVKYKPVDEEFNLNFRNGYEIYSKLKAAEEAEKSKKTSEKKKVASATMDGEGGSKEKPYKTTKDLRNKDWSDYDLAV